MRVERADRGGFGYDIRLAGGPRAENPL